MTRKEYMKELTDRLSRLPRDEKEEALNYYIEYFEDARVSDDDVVPESLAAPEEVSVQILSECAQKATMEPPKTVKAGMSTVWIVILAILASPIAFPLVIVALSLLFALVVTVGALVVSAVAVGASLLVAGIVCIVLAIKTLFTSTAIGIVALGGGLILIGLGILGCIAIGYIAKFVCFLITKLFTLIFCRKKAKVEE